MVFFPGQIVGCGRRVVDMNLHRHTKTGNSEKRSQEKSGKARQDVTETGIRVKAVGQNMR